MTGTPRTFDLDQTLAFGFHFPARMTVLPLGGGALALVSPIPIDDALAATLATLGDVRYLVAPNLLHHLYLAAAIGRYPGATVLAPPGLASKRPDLRIDGTLDRRAPEPLSRAVDVLRIDGAPSVDEYALFHRDSRTLVVTDLVFNVTQPRGVVAHLTLALVGCHGRLAQSRAWRFFVKDRAAARASAERLVALPTETLVMAHGEVVTRDARERLTTALRRLLGPTASAFVPKVL